jgi:branched-chain amino acid transport system permease protein
VIAQQVVNGLLLGAVYSLVALGYWLVMGVLGILNVAISEIFMMGAYLGFVVVLAHRSIWLAVPIAMVGAAVLGLIVERFGYKPLRDAPPIVPLLSTVGFSLIFQNVATNVWGSDPVQLPESIFARRMSFGTIEVGPIQMLIVACTGSLILLLALVVKRSWLGRALRAVSESRDVAMLLGVPADTVTIGTFVISGALAGAAGCLVGLHYSVINPYIGVETGLKGIAVMIVGGVNNVWGSLVAGPLIGIAEVLAVAYGASSYRDIVAYGLLICMLLLRPQGLLGGTISRSGRA